MSRSGRPSATRGGRRPELRRSCEGGTSHAGCLVLNLICILLALTSPVAQGQLLPGDLQALQDISRSLSDLPGTDFLKTWDFTLSSPCTAFVGVSCSDATSGVLRVVILNLGAPSGGFRGTIPPSIGNLDALTQFSIAPGQVSGVIPISIGSLTSLQYLGLSNNRLAGAIPDTLQSCRSLQYLDLSYNHLVGPIPQGVANLPSLVSVNLQRNNLGGIIPSFASNRLSHLDVSRNVLVGTLPGYLPPSLRYLSVLRNSIGGTIDVVGSLSSLEYLDLSRNLFVGSVPQQLFGFPLSYLLLHRNLLSGTISPAGPVRINEVDLSNNRFRGALSPYLASVESLYVNNNLFTGEVPADYVASLLAGSMKNLYVQHNYFTSFAVASNLPFVSSLCTQYNCFLPPGGTPCPAKAGKQVARPWYQCN